MTIRSLENLHPHIADSAYVDESAQVIGDVTIGADASIWPTAVVRGDIHSIKIGARTNIQDGSILHVTHDSPFQSGGFSLELGENITVGHRVVLHGCTIGDNSLIGMGAVIMDGVRIDSGAFVGAGSLVPGGKHLQGGYLWLGSPVKRIRTLNDQEREYLGYSAKHYVELKNRYLSNNTQ